MVFKAGKKVRANILPAEIYGRQQVFSGDYAVRFCFARPYATAEGGSPASGGASRVDPARGSVAAVSVAADLFGAFAAGHSAAAAPGVCVGCAAALSGAARRRDCAAVWRPGASTADAAEASARRSGSFCPARRRACVAAPGKAEVVPGDTAEAFARRGDNLCPDRRRGGNSRLYGDNDRPYAGNNHCGDNNTNARTGRNSNAPATRRCNSRDRGNKRGRCSMILPHNNVRIAVGSR